MDYKSFWTWFCEHEQAFFQAVQEGDNIETDFFDLLAPQLEALKDGIYYVAGMYDEQTAEFILTADGEVRNIVFIEELVAAAPEIPGWRFTALKPALDIENVRIEMDGRLFDEDKLSFYANDLPDYPDEIDIAIIHPDMKEADKDLIISGTHLFLDNYLGELAFVTTVDRVEVMGPDTATQPLIPIGKLKDFLGWRQMEFLEKYEWTKRNTQEEDQWMSLSAQTRRGNSIVAVVNQSALQWEGKASHPWILSVEIRFTPRGPDGMPDKPTYESMDELEEKLGARLSDEEQLYIARETGEGTRTIYYACKDFRKASKELHEIAQENFEDLQLDYSIYKDKYWQSLERFVFKG